VVGDDAVNEGESQAGAAGLGGVKGNEYLLEYVLWDARTIIPDPNLRIAVVRSGGNLDPDLSINGFRTVAEQVREHLA